MKSALHRIIESGTQIIDLVYQDRRNFKISPDNSGKLHLIAFIMGLVGFVVNMVCGTLPVVFSDRQSQRNHFLFLI